MRHQASARAVISLLLLVSVATTAAAQETGPYNAARPFGTLRQQAAVQQAWLKERLEVNLPAVMRAHGVDMWVVTMREYNEDPVFRGLVSATTFAARRRSIYIFFDRGARRASSGWRSAARRRAGCTRSIAASSPRRRRRRPSCGEWSSGGSSHGS